MSSKGKAIASSGKGKRKLTLEDEEEIAKQKRNRAVLQFFEDSAMEFDADSDHDDSEFDDIEDFIDDIDVDLNVKNEPGKFESAPRVFPKEEELSGDELEKMLQDRYGSKSGYVKYAEDDYDSKRSVDRGLFQRSVAEPMIWRVKCKVGREKHAVFCLMQKFADMKELGTKLQIISAFFAEHIKGFIFIEAEKQSDVIEACNQLADVYYSLVTRVPINEASQLLVARKRHHEVKEGTWARVKSGIYRGDIAQVVAVNNDRKRATVKLIPRIDLQALASKYGAGGVSKKSKAVPPARLIPARELEEFQPHIQYRRDRDIGKVFQFLDNLRLKDGFLYKKVPFDSLSFWDVNPTEDELQKFAPPSNDASDNLEWLSQLYGEKKKDRSVNLSRGGGKGEGTSGSGGGKGEGTSVSGGGKGEGTSGSGGGKGEGTSGSNEESSFEVHDLVLFGKRDFGMIVGMEKDESYKVLKNGPDGPVMMTLSHKDIKYLPLERKFTALDHRTKTISINDTVKIIDGASKGKQGVVKQIYRGVIFLYDEQDLDNAYFCTNSHMSEKVKNIDPASLGKDGGGFSGFEDAPSSPKSPLSPKRPWQMRESNSDDRRNNDDMFSVGQSLRIRVGPLKGYLCRVVAIRRSEVTVKLDSQQKVLTVKREHLAEVRGKISENTMSDNARLSSAFKPFEDLLGTEGGSNDWLQGSSGAADGNGWNAGAASNGGGGWGAFPSSGASVQAGTSAAGWSASVDSDSKKDDDAWLSKVDDQKNSSWGAAAPGSSSQDGVWGKSDGWGKTSGASGSGSWENAKGSGAGAGASSGWSKQKAGNDSDDQKNPSWGTAAHDKAVTSSSPAGVWGKSDGSWGKTPETGGSSSWENAGGSGGTAGPGWGKQKASNDSDDQKNSSWGDVAKDQKNSSWGKTPEAGGSSSWENASGSGGGAGPTGWGKQKASNDDETFKSSELVTEKASDAWGKAKGSDNPVEGAWAAKGAGAWENKNASSNESNKWQSSSATSDSQPGAWGQNSSGGGGWQKSSTGGNSNEKWSKQENASGWGGQDRASSQSGSWNNSGGSNSWDKSGGGRTNGNNGGRGQFQGGRGRGSFGRGQSSNWNKETEAGSSWSNSSGGNGDHGSDWGSKKDWKPKESSEPPAWGQKSTSGDDIGGDSGSNKNSSGDGGGWKSSGSAGGGWGTTQDDNASGGWKNNSNGGSSNSSWGKQEKASDWGKGNAGGQGGSSWNNNSNSNAWGANDKSNLGKDSWDKSDNDNDQGYGGRGRGFGGRRGRDDNRGGRWESGRGRGGSFGQGQGSSWSKENEGDNDQGGYGGRGFRGGRRGRGNYGGRDQFGRGRGNSFGQGQGQSSSWSKEDQSSSWSKENQSSSWSKENHAGSSWAGAGNGNQSSDWANSKDWNSDSGSERKDWSKPRESNETSSWSSPKEGGSSWGNKGNDNQKSSWGDGGGWGKSAGGASNNNNWGSAKSDDGQTSSGNKNPGDGGWGKSGGSAPSSWGSDSRDAKISGNSNTGDAAWGKSAGDAGAGASNSWGSASRRDDKPGDSWNASSSSKQGMSGQGGGGWGN